MADQEEVQTTSAGAEDTKTTPAPNVKEDGAGNDQQIQETEAKQEPSEKKYADTRQQKIWLKQQDDIRKRKQELDSREQEMQQKYGRWQAWEEQTEKGNPWQFLKDKNYDLHTLEKMALADGQDPRAVAQAIVEEETKKLRADYEAKFEELQNKRDAEQQEQFQADLAQKQQSAIQEIGQFLQANSEHFELTNVYPGAAETIFRVIWGKYQESDGKTVMRYEDAAAEVERVLEEEELRNNPLVRTSKAKNLLFGNNSEVVKSEKKSNDHVKDRSKSRQRATSTPEPRAISQKMSSVSTPTSGKQTAQQRREQLFEELRNGTWRPKPEYMTR